MTGFYSCHKTDKVLRVYMVLGDAVSKFKTFSMNFEPYFKVHNLVSVHPKSTIISQMTNLNMIVYLMVSVYRLVKI